MAMYELCAGVCARKREGGYRYKIDRRESKHHKSKHHKKPSNHRLLTLCELCLRVCARESVYIHSL